eukprot:110153-Alexandrium_andersonii.AAC.1
MDTPQLRLQLCEATQPHSNTSWFCSFLRPTCLSGMALTPVPGSTAISKFPNSADNSAFLLSWTV